MIEDAQELPSLKLTASLPLKIGAPWKRKFLLETTIFRGELLVLGSVKGLMSNEMLRRLLDVHDDLDLGSGGPPPRRFCHRC